MAIFLCRKRVNTEWTKLKNYIRLEGDLDSVYDYASSVLDTLINVGSSGGNPLETWKSRKAYFELRERWIDRKKRLYESCTELELALGEAALDFIE